MIAGRTLIFLILAVWAYSSALAGDLAPARDPDQIYFPNNYTEKTKWPLVVLLHAFKVSGKFQKSYFGLGHRAKEDGFILYVPGTVRDNHGNRIWNAMPYCCNHDEIPVDDVSYLERAIREVIAKHRVDPDRITLLGHSNGAMMAHRMACEHADLFAGIASLAGSGMTNLADCKPSSPLSILEIHAKKDNTVPYYGMTEKRLEQRLRSKPLYPYSSRKEEVRFPSATELTEDWASKNKCNPARREFLGKSNYLLMNPFRKETSKARWKQECASGTEVELWTLNKGGHVPLFNRKFKDHVVQFLLRQKKVRER